MTIETHEQTRAAWDAIAAGSCALSIPAARLGAHVLATDLSPAMLERLERRAREAALSVETHVVDGHALSLEDDSFDIAGSQFGVTPRSAAAAAIARTARETMDNLQRRFGAAQSGPAGQVRRRRVS